jgi:hypothetical protein
MEIASYEDDLPAPPKPKTATVVAMLTLAALTFSYLGAYAIAGALVDSDVLPHWLPGHDPRARWMAFLFGALLGASLLVSAAARSMSKRQLQRIDAMAEE